MGCVRRAHERLRDAAPAWGLTRLPSARIVGMDVTVDSFQTEVIDRSHEKPVVVDFWAAWCGPCQSLGPVIESEIEATDGAVELAKVDVDANQTLAQQYHVQGIPAVKAFRNGEIVAEFTGAQPAAAVRAFLEQLTGPSALEGELARLREAGDLPEVVAAIDAGDWDTACTLLLEGIAAADGDDREPLRELLVAIFAELGQQHETSVRYRKRLATVLF